jgi:hypothetical protein
MTIDNVKDQPGLPRTDDINTIFHNFVKYYSKLYEHKKICPLTLDAKEAKELNKPITGKEMLTALINTPKGKSPGTDRLLYEYYKKVPEKAAVALTGISNLVPELKAQPASCQITISVLSKEADLYTIYKFCPISLLNTDYKLVMRVWANRLGPILARKIGHYQRRFILDRYGQENIINIQMIIDLIIPRMKRGQ